MGALRPPSGIDEIARNIVLLDELSRVVRQLDDQGIRAVALKGAGLLLTVYPDLGPRTMVDLDLLVEADELAVAERILWDCDYVRTVSGPPAYRRKRGSIEIRIDLHTELFHLIPSRLCDLRARCVTRDLDGVTVRVPSPEDHLILVAVHAVLGHGQLRSCWIEDLRRLSQGNLNWSFLVELAVNAHVANAVYLALEHIPSRDSSTPWGIPKDQREILRRWGGRGLRAGFLRWVLSRPETPDAGHLLRWVYLDRHRGMTLARQFFPGPRFLRQRYGLETSRGVIAAHVWRPIVTLGRAVRLAYLLTRNLLTRNPSGIQSA